MKQVLDTLNTVDADGNPTGGHVVGRGITIVWQNGPLSRGAERKEPNGAFVEGVLEAARQRLQFYQEASGGRFHCRENQEAIVAINIALQALMERTARREAEGTEGTHQGS